MDRQPSSEPDRDPARAPGSSSDPDRAPGTAGDPALPPSAAGDPRLTGFASNGKWEMCPPSATLAAAVEAASGPGWRCPGATDDELIGVLRRLAALESWAAAGKLGVIREMMRRERPPALSGNRHGDLPDSWGESLGHELAAALGVSVQSADTTALLAWDLQVRLPGIGVKLADGTLSYFKAMLITKELAVLGEDDAAKAEALILEQLAQTPNLTPGQLAKLAAQATVTVDPNGAERRREAAEKLDTRVRLWREQSGAAALVGRNLPTDEALAAYASVNTRTAQYKKSKAFPDASMDQLRALAYLDLLNGVSAADRLAKAEARAAAERSAEAAAGRADEGDPSGFPCRECDDSCVPAADDEYDGENPAEDGPDDTGPDGKDPGDNGPGGNGPAPADGGPGDGSVDDVRPRLTDLVIPLLTLLGLAERPGESHSLGPLDPALCRDLAATAANSPDSEWCVTVTDANGFAIGHGCARLGRGDWATWKTWLSGPGTRDARLAALPSRVNLTIPTAALPSLPVQSGTSPLGTRSKSPPGTSSQPQDFGTWKLTLPGGRTHTVKIEPVPTYECDHGHESHAYEPNDTLRHLIQIRDGNCTFPPCSRHAREADFEHAIPYHKGGRTCACNAGARSRQCHRIKQSPGWEVIQPLPGWHQWKTPSGRIYTQEPKRYPT